MTINLDFSTIDWGKVPNGCFKLTKQTGCQTETYKIEVLDKKAWKNEKGKNKNKEVFYSLDKIITLYNKSTIQGANSEQVKSFQTRLDHGVQKHNKRWFRWLRFLVVPTLVAKLFRKGGVFKTYQKPAAKDGSPSTVASPINPKPINPATPPTRSPVNPQNQGINVPVQQPVSVSAQPVPVPVQLVEPEPTKISPINPPVNSKALTEEEQNKRLDQLIEEGVDVDAVQLSELLNAMPAENVMARLDSILTSQSKEDKKFLALIPAKVWGKIIGEGIENGRLSILHAKDYLSNDSGLTQEQKNEIASCFILANPVSEQDLKNFKVSYPSSSDGESMDFNEEVDSSDSSEVSDEDFEGFDSFEFDDALDEEEPLTNLENLKALFELYPQSVHLMKGHQQQGLFRLLRRTDKAKNENHLRPFFEQFSHLPADERLEKLSPFYSKKLPEQLYAKEGFDQIRVDLCMLGINVFLADNGGDLKEFLTDFLPSNEQERNTLIKFVIEKHAKNLGSEQLEGLAKFLEDDMESLRFLAEQFRPLPAEERLKKLGEIFKFPRTEKLEIYKNQTGDWLTANLALLSIKFTIDRNFNEHLNSKKRQVKAGASIESKFKEWIGSAQEDVRSEFLYGFKYIYNGQSSLNRLLTSLINYRETLNVSMIYKDASEKQIGEIFQAHTKARNAAISVGNGLTMKLTQSGNQTLLSRESDKSEDGFDLCWARSAITNEQILLTLMETMMKSATLQMGGEPLEIALKELLVSDIPMPLSEAECKKVYASFKEDESSVIGKALKKIGF